MHPKHLSLALLLLTATAATQAAERPNIVILLADDLGYGDVGFHGSDIRTPNLDRLASSGTVLERYYVCPMCSPTRAGLMTGRYPLRFGMMRSVVPPYRDFGIDPAEVTIAEMLGTAGYEHRAVIGKWHLGHRREKWLPLANGFTHAVGCYNGAIDYFTHERDGQLDWHRNGQPDRTDGYVTDLVGDAAIEFIESVPVDKPYFLYVPFTAPHSPFQAKDEDLAKYPNRKGKKRTYAAMVDCLDQNIGRILAAIDARGDADNTFVLFSSDNGGVAQVGDNGPLRGSKLTPYEGGVRVAAAVRWPAGGITGGGRIDEAMGYLDVFPTVMSVAGVAQTPTNELDGVDMLAAMRGGEPADPRPWFTYQDQGGGRQQKLAVHQGEWKLVAHRPAPDAKKGKSRYELFRIAEDPHETTDVAADYPEVVSRLQGSLERFFSWQAAEQVPRYDVGRDKLPPLTNWQPVE
ncbi:sulfatase-like hydrolase/transferase [Aeoliella sp. ICT_H6.2]|uniref:Sulfatase-like hydrolase/transferase n=1 Tax=Aeoliella straminimaris TaxID=2954799 RepID=A0A9X2FBA7_9BACT|nr:sulfatase-like hydrolase/transferase [Aeoliella straminimaris]MCO6045725.1 sulfatase-like hydrolase/transferase [Aeoliella straminimaris]